MPYYAAGDWYAAGDPGFLSDIGGFLGGLGTKVGGVVTSFGRKIGLGGPADVVQRWQETGNPLGSLISTARERGWGGAARDVFTGLGYAASGGLFGAGAATVASQLGGLFTSAEPSRYAGQPEYEDLMTSTYPVSPSRSGYSTPAYWQALEEEEYEPEGEPFYYGVPADMVHTMPTANQGWLGQTPPPAIIPFR